MTTKEQFAQIEAKLNRHDVEFSEVRGAIADLARAVNAQAGNLNAQATNLDKLTQVVNTLAGSIVAHDAQIEALVKAAERHERIWQDLQKQWQAYLNTLPRN